MLGIIFYKIIVPMNEIIFLVHIFLVLGFLLLALRLGKQGLFVFICIQAILANVFVIKEICLFGLQVTASDVFSVGTLLGLNALQEYFGKNETKKAFYLTVFCMIFFVIMSKVHLWYRPSMFDNSQGAFDKVLSMTPRIFLSSMGISLLIQLIDLYLYGFFKRHLGFFGRMGSALLISEFLDTFLFTFIGLYHVVERPWQVICFSFFIKCVVIFCASFFMLGIRRYAKV